MAKYYVSSAGNDSNNGLSKTTPFKTTTKINALIAGNQFFAGDAVMFKRGDVFPGGCLTGSSSSWGANGSIEISSYGEGAKPLFDMYKYVVMATAWVHFDPTTNPAWGFSDPNIWRLDMQDISSFTGNNTNTLDNGANAGSLKVDGKLIGKKLETTTKLHNSITQWDFYGDNTQYLYVRSFADPSTLAQVVAISVEGTSALNIISNVNYFDIDILGHGGVSCNFGGMHDVHFTNISVREYGGSTLSHYTPDPTIRYGTGIQAFGTAKDCSVTGCYFEEGYEAPMTLQCPLGTTGGYANISFKYNRVNRCPQAFEIWHQDPAGFFTNIKFQNNICENTGYDQRHYQHTNTIGGGTIYFDQFLGVQILMYGNKVNMRDVEISNNIFFKSANGVYYWSLFTPYVNDYTRLPNSHDNDIFTSPALRINSNTSSSNSGANQTVENYSAFVSAFNLETNSRWYIIPNTIADLNSLTQYNIAMMGNSVASKYANHEAVTEALSTSFKAYNEIFSLTAGSNSLVYRDVTTKGALEPVLPLAAATNGFNDAKSTLAMYRGDGTVSILNEPSLNFNGHVQYFGDAFTGAQLAQLYNGTTYLRTFWFGTWTSWTTLQFTNNLTSSFATLNNTLYPSTQAVSDYVTIQIAAAKAGLWNDRGNYNPTITSAYPAGGGSGSGGAIKKGDIWMISVAGNMGTVVVDAGDTVRALSDSPGQTGSAWTVMEHNIGYTPFNAANMKVTANPNMGVLRGGKGEINMNVVALTALAQNFDDAFYPYVSYVGDGLTTTLIGQPTGVSNFNGMVVFFGKTDGTLLNSTGYQEAMKYDCSFVWRRMLWGGVWRPWHQITVS